MQDLTTEKGVVELMKTSKTEQEWNANGEKVKQANDGFPGFWFRAIIMGGVMRDTAAKWGGDDKIHVTAY